MARDEAEQIVPITVHGIIPAEAKAHNLDGAAQQHARADPARPAAGDSRCGEPMSGFSAAVIDMNA